MPDDTKTQAPDLTPAETRLLEEHRTRTRATLSKIDPAMQRVARVLLEHGVEVASAAAKPKPVVVMRGRAQHAIHVAHSVRLALDELSLHLTPAGTAGPSLTSTVDFALPELAELRLEGVDDATAFPEPPKPAAA